MNKYKQLFEKGIALGMCNKYKNMWRDDVTAAELCDWFHRGQDFCIEHNYPSIEDILQTFSQDEMVANGIFVNATGEYKAQRRMIVIGNSDMTIILPNAGMCDVYCRHNAKVRFKVGMHAFAYITAMDNCEVSIMQKGIYSRLVLSHYGGEIRNERMFDKINEKIGG